jgi:hypothetical protein
MKRRIGESREVLAEHARRHYAECGTPVPADVMTCPCGRALALLCPRCGDLLFGALVDGIECEHVADLEAVTR